MPNKKIGFGARIKEARERQKPKKMSQQALQVACGWENGNSRIANYESEEREPSISDFIKMATVLGDDPAFLAFGTVMADQNVAKIVDAYRKANETGRNYLLDTAEIVARKHRR